MTKSTATMLIGASDLAQPETTPVTTLSDSKIPTGVRVTAAVLRLAFIGTLVLIVLSVSMPQNETIWTIYDTPLDVIRLLLGIAVCVWLVIQLFVGGPRDLHGYRTWLYLGLVAVPFAVITLVYVWWE